MKHYQITIVNSIDQMQNLAESWNDLLLRSQSNTIFLTWEWQFSWAECFINSARELFILTIRRGNELVGIAPWYIHKTEYLGLPLKQIEFLGARETDSDYLDVIIKRGMEKEVTLSIYDFLFSKVPSRWDCFMLRDIPADSLFLLHFLTKIEEEGKYAEITQSSFCPIVKLPRTTDDYLLGLSPNRRQQFKRHLRVLNRENHIEHRSFLSKDIPLNLNRFFSLYQEKKDDGSDNLKRFLERFVSKCKDKNWVQIDFMTANNNDIASLLHLHYHGTLSMYLMAIDKTFNPKISIGNLLVGLSIQRSINQGDSFYDFLKGTEHYKFHWANCGKTSLNFIFYQRKPISALFALRRFLKYIAKIILR